MENRCSLIIQKECFGTRPNCGCDIKTKAVSLLVVVSFAFQFVTRLSSSHTGKSAVNEGIEIYHNFHGLRFECFLICPYYMQSAFITIHIKQ